MLTGDPIFPGDSDIDQIYHITKCFGDSWSHIDPKCCQYLTHMIAGLLCPRHKELIAKNPIFNGTNVSNNQPTGLKTLFPNWWAFISNQNITFLTINFCAGLTFQWQWLPRVWMWIPWKDQELNSCQSSHFLHTTTLISGLCKNCRKNSMKNSRQTLYWRQEKAFPPPPWSREPQWTFRAKEAQKNWQWWEKNAQISTKVLPFFVAGNQTPRTEGSGQWPFVWWSYEEVSCVLSEIQREPDKTKWTKQKPAHHCRQAA